MAGKYKKKKHKVIKMFSVLVMFVLVIGVTIAVTLALLNKTTDTTVNTFTGNAGIDLEVREPDWDGGDGQDPRLDSSEPEYDSSMINPIPTPELGENKALNYTPGMEIGKNPYLVNKTEYNGNDENSNEWKNACEYVAIKLEYQVWRPDKTYDASKKDDIDEKHEYWETVSYDEFAQLADIYYDSTNNVQFSTDWINETRNVNNENYSTGDKKNTIFYYKNYLTPYKTVSTSNNALKSYTGELFKSINIKQGLDVESIFMCNATGHYYDNNNMNKGVKLSGIKDTLSITQDTTNKTYSYIDGSDTSYVHVGLIPFRINVTGYAVQAYVDRELINSDSTIDNANGNYKEYMDKLLNLIERGDTEKSN